VRVRASVLRPRQISTNPHAWRLLPVTWPQPLPPRAARELFVAAPFWCPARRVQPFGRLALGTLKRGMCALGSFPLGCLAGLFRLRSKLAHDGAGTIGGQPWHAPPARRGPQRASFGTQNTFSAKYSSGSSAAAGSSASSAARLASKALEMCLRKISPRQTCL
jgi:hypothetical protein